MNAPATFKPHYASRPKVAAAAQTLHDLRAQGLDVAAIEVSPDGTIKVFSSAAFPVAPRDEFEAWDQSGKLG
ncbi:hypothetical protein [Novosphingobium mangrovi (ex Huang et al. 2023)]|uniref:Uncharacterized protein n=1 Tax=Novosphingobium mangrovi (ex Huang et al. 2023) TaxID=2976432 RepID=A0ABT2I110_9SPHN|nr:hypothetical protein [Novosphingobium mangrovi (ex Huang et al. 2023)]MCT2398484.1 hypothetical protein [Novosphingobium mangrovi (ex Huang et al. 2023)]